MKQNKSERNYGFEDLLKMLNLDIGWLFINFQKLTMYALFDFLVYVQTIQPQTLEPN